MATMALTAEQLAATSLMPGLLGELKRRGVNVYTMSELWSVAGRARSGEFLSGMIERPLFGLTLQERVDLFRKCSPVFGIVTARMNRIAALEWSIEKDSKVEDRIESRLKMLHGIWKEYDDQTDVQHLMVRRRCVILIRQVLVECKPDLSNFSTALIRWRRRLREQSEDKSIEIQEWLQEPNAHDNYDDFVKKTVQDAMVHGSFAWYKERDPETKLIDNIYCLPGGTVIPMRSKYVSGQLAFIQDIPALEPKMYFQDEITYGSYVPSSAMAYGFVPLESLVNKLAEVLFFDQSAAMRADGTDIPQKVVLFGEQSPFGDVTVPGASDDLKMPLDKDEQQRLEVIMNEARKGAIRVLSGYGVPAILDLSKADTFQYQMQRQEKIREEVALVFNMSNMEVNMTGSTDTSGRSTSETQERIEREKGIYPIVKLLESKHNREILPQRWGTTYHLKYKSGLSDEEELKIDGEKVRSKLYSVNEVRMLRGEEPFPDERYDLPDQAATTQPDGSERDPFNVLMSGGGQ